MFMKIDPVVFKEIAITNRVELEYRRSTLRCAQLLLYYLFCWSILLRTEYVLYFIMYLY